MAEVQIDDIVRAEPPHSIAQASVDEKGRLKLPAEFLEYLEIQLNAGAGRRIRTRYGQDFHHGE